MRIVSLRGTDNGGDGSFTPHAPAWHIFAGDGPDTFCVNCYRDDGTRWIGENSLMLKPVTDGVSVEKEPL